MGTTRRNIIVTLLQEKTRTVIVSYKTMTSPHLHLTSKLVSSKRPMVRPHCKPMVVPPRPWDSLWESSLVLSALSFLREESIFFSSTITHRLFAGWEFVAQTVRVCVC